MSGIEGDTTRVSYTVKELFARIDGKLDALAAVLDAKADHTALIALELRVDKLEADRDKRDGSSTMQRAIIASLVAIVGLLVPVAVHFLP